MFAAAEVCHAVLQTFRHGEGQFALYLGVFQHDFAHVGGNEIFALYGEQGFGGADAVEFGQGFGKLNGADEDV